VRSANRAARVAERSLKAGLRPLLLPARLEDPPQKINFVEGKDVVAPGGAAVAECTDDAVYLAAGLRNVGAGIAVLHGWHFYPERVTAPDHPPPRGVHAPHSRPLRPGRRRRLWQGSFRDPSSEAFAQARAVIERHDDWAVDILYSDAEDGQRMISRYEMIAREDGVWLASAGRH
jgi:hypothetical protein